MLTFRHLLAVVAAAVATAYWKRRYSYVTA
jgi:hypothetical protein